MPDSQVIVHIIYVHGFQGDHTTFQSFPTDLHKALLPKLPSHITLRSMLYPTYKSKRPISVATQNFLNWLDTLPYGPVIICGHSMGGLLVAEAATSQTHSAARRVIALLAFDVPFLGMHPHVVISGIASLFPNKKGDSNEHGSEREKHEGGGLKSEREMNDGEHVHVPEDGASATPSPSTSKISLPNPSPKSLTTSSNTPPPLPPRPSSNTLTPSLPPRSTSNLNSLTPSPRPRSRPRSPSPTPAIISRTLDFVESHANHPLVRFISKNHADPLGAAKRWVVESFEFGVCMFDPKGLTARYGELQKWNKPWVAFWTETAPGAARTVEEKAADEAPKTHEEGVKQEQDATAALGRLLEPTLPEDSPALREDSKSPAPDSPPLSPEPAATPEQVPLTKDDQKAIEKSNKDLVKQQEREVKAREKAEKALRKQQDKELKALGKQNDAHPHSPHHFIVRPFKAPSSGVHLWEQVKIRGAKDEVEAHCGLFLRDINWEYDAFVERVSVVVRGWVDGLDGSMS